MEETKEKEQADFSEHTVIFTIGKSKKERYYNVVAQNREKAEQAFNAILRMSILNRIVNEEKFSQKKTTEEEKKDMVEAEAQTYHIYTVTKKI